MIFYFSGTGNSRMAAEFISESIGENLYFIPKTDPGTARLEGESLGFVFPVYSWGVPPIVVNFVRALSKELRHEVYISGKAVWCVMTCGDDTGLAPEMFRDILEECELELNGGWSVIMPNNYVLLPGFDVDPKDVEQRKLEEAIPRLMEISKLINRGIYERNYAMGSWSWIKTKWIYPLFRRWGIFPSKWHSLESCVGCGICAGSCPVDNIEMVDGRPKWGSRCVSCLACYHSCPRHCVEYGRITSGKGQYFNPGKQICRLRPDK